MEKRDCGIVRDLMPLVVDQIAGKESTELVERHVGECEECREMLNQMRTRLQEAPVEPDTGFIRFCRRLEREIRWRRVILGALIVILACVTICGGLWLARYKMYVWGTAYSPAIEECKFEFRAEDDGFLRITIPAPEGYGFLGWSGEVSADRAIVRYWPERSQWKQLIGESDSRRFSDENGEISYLDDTIRLVDGVVCYHETIHGTKYDFDAGSYVDDYQVVDTPIREFYFGSEKLDLQALAAKR